MAPRPRVYVDLKSPAVTGRLIIELFADKVPKTCEKCVDLNIFTIESAANKFLNLIAFAVCVQAKRGPIYLTRTAFFIV